MKIRFCLFFILFNLNTQAASRKYKIVTSIAPLASIAAMLLEDNVEINTLSSSNVCPHHHQAKPSDLNKVKSADMNIYIDKEFDGFAAKLMNNNSAKIVKVSDLKTLIIVKNNNSTNWHFWLNLDNVIILLKEFSDIFSNQFPELKSSIHANLEQSLKQVKNLSKIKKRQLQQLSNAILLSDSLEYFFFNNPMIVKIYEPPHKSLKYLNQLKNLLAKNSQKKCLILSNEQDVKSYLKFNQPVVQLQSENWEITDKFKNLYYVQYLKMIDQLKQCNKV